MIHSTPERLKGLVWTRELDLWALHSCLCCKIGMSATMSMN